MDDGRVSRRAHGERTASTASANADKNADLNNSIEDVDMNQPVVFQVGLLGPRYYDWVYKPQRGKPRFFSSAFAERLSKTTWWVIVLVWTPISAYCFLLATAPRGAATRGGLLCAGGWPWGNATSRDASGVGLDGFGAGSDSCASDGGTSTGGGLGVPPALGWLMFGIGVWLWTLVEYSLHRFLFHLEARGYWLITAHFLFHGCHHKYPMDDMRLVMPPAAALPIAACVCACECLAFGRGLGLAAFSGTLVGYMAYDVLHYHCHFSQWANVVPFVRGVKRSHMRHHYREPHHAFGISTVVWDKVFNTYAKH